MKAYLIPGNGEDLESRNYRAVLEVYRTCGYEPHFLSIKWKYRTIDDWVKQIEEQVNPSDLQDSLLSGFSFGSIIALTVAAKVNPKQLLLFSLSPYFQEDMPLPKKYEERAGKRRIEKFKKLSFNKLVADITCPTKIFLGSEEKKKYKTTRHRCKEAHRRIANSELILVDGAGHDVANPRYVKAIKSALNS